MHDGGKIEGGLLDRLEKQSPGNWRILRSWRWKPEWVGAPPHLTVVPIARSDIDDADFPSLDFRLKNLAHGAVMGSCPCFSQSRGTADETAARFGRGSDQRSQ